MGMRNDESFESIITRVGYLIVVFKAEIYRFIVMGEPSGLIGVSREREEKVMKHTSYVNFRQMRM